MPKLNIEEIGMDKNGNQITGKTWVHRKDSFYQIDTNEVRICKTEQILFEGENAGYIYVMRNPVMAKNVFKVGRTNYEAKERAKQLSKTSVPDSFHVMTEWNVKDCVVAEKEIHTRLNGYRVDPRREFFQIEMGDLMIVINDVIDEINN